MNKTLQSIKALPQLRHYRGQQTFLIKKNERQIGYVGVFFPIYTKFLNYLNHHVWEHINFIATKLSTTPD